MSQDNLITLKHQSVDEKTGKTIKDYIETTKNKKGLANAPKLTLKKYSKKLKKRVLYTETKKPYKK